MRVMIIVTHLLGTGHLARVLTLGRAFVAGGHDVTVVSGGLPVPHFDRTGLEVVQLPSLQSDGVDFTRLLDLNGDEASPELRADRTAMMLDTLRRVQPHALLTELFPFGRRNLRDEFLALLEAAKEMVPRPRILTSIRDILAPPGKPEKVMFAEEMVATFYDSVLVHSDPDVVTLEQSWPVSDRLKPKLLYTGFVGPTAVPAIVQRSNTVMVSAGGGTVGQPIFEAACDAAALKADTHWHLLVGGDDARRSALAEMAPANVTVEAPRADFRELLAQAGASVSMCGYNTALDVLQTGVPAVLIPFDDGNEVEQRLRARALASQPATSVLLQSDLSGPRLADAVSAVMSSESRACRTSGMNGAAETVRLVTRIVEGAA